LRGNIPTRLEKAADFDAIVVALAALDRLGLHDRATDVLEPSVMLPMVAQGALAVECRLDDERARGLLAAIDDASAHQMVDAERAFLAALGGGCNLPCAALARAEGAELSLAALLASADGRIVLRSSRRGRDPQVLGTEAAEDVLDAGGRELLDAGVGA
jgi:hydroxymethylbilane synthase